MPQINEYINTATSVTAADWLDLDKSKGDGIFQSQKLSLPVLAASLSTFNPSIGRNIYDVDGTLAGDRIVDFNSLSMGWINIKQFATEATTLPTLGRASFSFSGFGTTAADELFRIGNQAGYFTKWYGDGTIEHNGRIVTNYPSSALPAAIWGNVFTAVAGGTRIMTLANNGLSSGVGEFNSDGTFKIGSPGSVTPLAQFGYDGNVFFISSSILQEKALFIGSHGSVEPSAILQTNSTTKGFLKPRMTTAQKNSIASPSVGLEVFDTTLNESQFYNGTAWQNVGKRTKEIKLFHGGNVTQITVIGNSFENYLDRAYRLKKMYVIFGTQNVDVNKSVNIIIRTEDVDSATPAIIDQYTATCLLTTGNVLNKKYEFTPEVDLPVNKMLLALTGSFTAGTQVLQNCLVSLILEEI